MKKTIFCLLLAGWLAAANDSAWCQLTMTSDNREMRLPSVQSYEFIKYGNIRPSLYTGTVNYTVPLYTYKDNDFEIPISLDYASNGYMPNLKIQPQGLGWVLNAGGCITREIRGIPDDSDYHEPRPTPGSQQRRLGFANTRIFDLTLDSRFPISWEPNAVCQPYFGYQEFSGADGLYEIEPDIFHFNFAGYTGSFHFWFGNQVKIFNASPGALNLKIECESDLHSFTIITPDGYKYNFMEKEEVESIGSDADMPKTIQAWKLNSITAPNGRIAYFDYTNRAETHFLSYMPRSVNVYHIIEDFFPMSEHTTSTEFVQSKTNTLPLSKIVIDNTAIHFNYEPVRTEKYSQKNAPQLMEASPQLRSIDIKYKENTIRHIAFGYAAALPGSGSFLNNGIPFLTSIDIPGEGIYRFEYYNRETGGFPPYGCFSLDHWGYYNGKNDSQNPSDFLNSLTYNENNASETIAGNLRDPDFNYAVRGMLKRITYPTGGYSLLEYEPHYYSRKVERNLSTDYKPQLSGYSDSLQCGGVRIHTIRHFTGDGLLSGSSTYFYRNAEGKSSGILLASPRYGIAYRATAPEGQKKIMKYRSLTDFFKYDKTHIEYTQVIEKLNDGSYNIYKFSNYETDPDIPYSKNTGLSATIPTYIYIELEQKEQGNTEPKTYYFDKMPFYIQNELSGYLIHLLTPPLSRQGMRGKIINKKIYTASNLLVKEEIFQYDTLGSFTYLQPSRAGETMIFHNVEEFSTVMSGHTVKDYTSDGVLTSAGTCE